MINRYSKLISFLVLVGLLLSACGLFDRTPEPTPLQPGDSTPEPSQPPVISPTLQTTGTPDGVVPTTNVTLGSTETLVGGPSETPNNSTEDPNINTTPTGTRDVVGISGLPITFPVMVPEIANYFNRIARPDDLALIVSGRLDLLQRISSGQVRVGYASWALAEQDLPSLVGKTDIISYNPEHWEQTPEDEKINLPATVQRASEVTHAYGMKLMVSPDLRFAMDYIDEIAKYADIVGLQGQRKQEDPQVFEAWARELIEKARASNPEVLIFVQVGATHGSARQMYAAVDTIVDDIDGISIWVNSSTFHILKDFVNLIRSNN